MSAPESDRAGIRQVIRALRKSGHVLVEVYDLADESVPVTNEREAIEAIMAVDDAYLYVRLPEGHPTNEDHPAHHKDGKCTGWVRFVMGNEPEEVVCDYTVSLSDPLDALTSGWGDE